ncbi:MAG: hypothetical protein AAFV43_04665 [Planctomycetota bacterium]
MAKKETTLQTLYRLTIMVGTLSVGSLGAYQYGPPAEDVAQGINQAVAMVRERLELEPAELAAPAAAQPIAAAASPEAPRFDTAVAPVAFEQDTVSQIGPDSRLPGAIVEPWGDDGLQRASIAIPGPLGDRRMDAVGATPTEALERLASKAEAAGLR